jgi:hypothetical protein
MEGYRLAPTPRWKPKAENDLRYEIPHCGRYLQVPFHFKKITPWVLMKLAFLGGANTQGVIPWRIRKYFIPQCGINLSSFFNHSQKDNFLHELGSVLLITSQNTVEIPLERPKDSRASSISILGTKESYIRSFIISSKRNPLHQNRKGTDSGAR